MVLQPKRCMETQWNLIFLVCSDVLNGSSDFIFSILSKNGRILTFSLPHPPILPWEKQIWGYLLTLCSINNKTIVKIPKNSGEHPHLSLSCVFERKAAWKSDVVMVQNMDWSSWKQWDGLVWEAIRAHLIQVMSVFMHHACTGHCVLEINE